jgi:hypothetical protein
VQFDSKSDARAAKIPVHPDPVAGMARFQKIEASPERRDLPIEAVEKVSQ